MFPSVSPKQSFPELESEVLAFWKKNNIFQKSIDSRPENNPYRFYDGPPFITGTPHYGSLLSSIVKDAVGRYWTMRDRRVERVWGWDCHGLPIEEKVQKKLGLTSNKEIEERGVKEFIDGCYEYTNSTSIEWNWYIDKIGRWVDMDHAYRTMDQDYMESVLWVFRELWDKGLIYEGKRVSLYSWKLGTPISNFEVAMDDTYQEVNDPAITVKFHPELIRACAIIIENAEGEVLLGYNTKKGFWSFPGGKAEAGETHEQMVMRELREETEIDLEILPEHSVLEQYDVCGGKIFDNHVYHIYVDSDIHIGNGEPEIFTEWKFFSKNALPDDIFDPTRYAIERISAGVTHKNLPLSILAWTTTPWTIPANMALAVGTGISYVVVENNNEEYIVAKNRVEPVFKGKGEYTILREFTGDELAGVSYTPPFPEYFYHPENEKNHHVYTADFATDTDGTGIVHIAPEFGDVDFGLAKEKGITITEVMDEAGKYTEQIFDYEGTHYLDANPINIERMKANGTLFKNESVTHRVPFCPRSATPLVQKAQSSWFIDIQSQKDALLEANKKINWFPEYLKYGRFAKGIESAPDWCISRTRYWGAPMPIWQNHDGSERLVIASREEIFERNKPYGQLEEREIDGKIRYFFTGGAFDGTELNLHRPYIDAIFLAPEKSEKPKKVLGVHGWTSRGLGSDGEGFWTHLRDVLTQENIGFHVPDFDKNEATKYSLWKGKLDTLDVTQYDTIVAHSFGCAVSMQYILEHKIPLDRLVLVAPSGLVGNSFLEKVLPEMTGEKAELRKLVKEIIVIHSKDDGAESAPYNYGKSLSEEIGAILVTVDGMNHDFRKGKSLISGIVLSGAPLMRIPEVLDVWMDSGSMPYAQMHYPFENKSAMEASFPADFIAEYVGQVRAWFYVMHVLGVLLNPKHASTPTPSFTNVITTGVINGNDGRKMSKSFGNFPDPRETILQYGADPIRFYMLNSPLLSGGDMDFKEEGILETVKNVMLPLWNTYSFFTLYANIDHWEQDTTQIWFCRHAESMSNIISKMSDNSDDPELTEKGREQARSMGERLKEQGIEFDVILHTDRIRTRDTAHIIGETLGFSGEYIVDDGFREQKAGEYANKTLTEMAEMIGVDVSDTESLRRAYKNNSIEDVDQYEAFILGEYQRVLDTYAGKKVLIISHAGAPRPILHAYHGFEEDIYYRTSIPNAEAFRLLTTPLKNPLDRWILSRLQILIGQVRDAMEGYDLSRACRAIVDYMDDLTNWYVRLSRRRFWGSGMTPDKQSAYSTLYTVLLEVSKNLAPFMPFLSENIYKGLVDNGKETLNSVHLAHASSPERFMVFPDLNRDMELCKNIVSLGLSLRSRKSIRVRQPLASVTITEKLDSYYQGIIRDELNVKEVRYEDPEKIAKKICKPDARKIGPKYGKDVQTIIVEAKNGNFIEKDDGVIEVAGFILESGEYTMEYVPLEGAGDVEGGNGKVIALDTTVTESLKQEGYARDIIRTVQEMRKEADYQVTDRILLSIEKNPLLDAVLERFSTLITSETLATFAPLNHGDSTKEISLGGEGETFDITLTIARDRM